MHNYTHDGVIFDCLNSTPVQNAGMGVGQGSGRVLGDLRGGRGSGLNPSGRYLSLATEQFFDEGTEWEADQEHQSAPQTRFHREKSRSIVTRNQSPDVGFDRSINPYRGCEHGCIYCYARPSHAYVDLSPGLDFEREIFIKENAAALLRKEFRRKRYKPETIVIGANTDPYQPIERREQSTRALLQVMLEFQHPVAIITKSALILRDRDLLTQLAAAGLIQVTVSVTSLDSELSRRLEPRASSPDRRLQAIRGLSEAGVPVSVLMAPIIPALNDPEIERVLAAVAGAGARSAGFVLLRLPHEVRELFRDWLERHFPQKAGRILHLIRTTRSGKENDPRFGYRMRGEGAYADLIAQRFSRAAIAHGLNKKTGPLETGLFRAAAALQPDLFAGTGAAR